MSIDVGARAHSVMNLREVKRNQRITLTTTMLQPFITEEGLTIEKSGSEGCYGQFCVS